MFEGVASCILFASFEAQLVSLHDRSKMRSRLYQSFAMFVYGAAFVATASTLFTMGVGEAMKYDTQQQPNTANPNARVNEKDAAFIFCIGCGLSALYLWDDDDPENPEYLVDEEQEPLRAWESFRRSCRLALRSKDSFLCGLASGFFEAALTVFLFSSKSLFLRDTPQSRSSLYVAFVSMMLSIMAGASCCCLLYGIVRLEALALVSQLAACSAALVLLVAPNYWCTTYCVNLLLFSAGLYLTVMGCLRVTIVSDDHRHSIYFLYRLPASIICLLGFALMELAPSSSGAVVFCFLSCATVLHFGLFKVRRKHGLSVVPDQPIPYIPLLDDETGLSNYVRRRNYTF